MHFSSPSGQRFSWWRPWKRGAVGFFSNGYCSVTTFLNMVRNVTPNPATGSQNCSFREGICSRFPGVLTFGGGRAGLDGPSDRPPDWHGRDGVAAGEGVERLGGVGLTVAGPADAGAPPPVCVGAGGVRGPPTAGEQ